MDISDTITIGWWVDGEYGDTIHCPTASSPEEAAEELFSQGYTAPASQSEEYRAWVYRLDEDGEEIDGRWIRHTVHPDEPPCEEDDHDWRSPYSVLGGLEENPGVAGKGGGVVVREVCRHCGRYRITDTWADDGHGGQMEDDCIWYEDADTASTEWIEEQHSSAQI